MRRMVFDIAGPGGALLVVVLLVAGGLLLWGHAFANSSVHHQQAQQQVVFPAKGGPALANPKIGPSVAFALAGAIASFVALGFWRARRDGPELLVHHARRAGSRAPDRRGSTPEPAREAAR